MQDAAANRLIQKYQNFSAINDGKTEVGRNLRRNREQYNLAIHKSARGSSIR
jgi:hypothetical protein